MRAALAGGLGLLAVAAVGWALMGYRSEVEPLPVASAPAVAERGAADPSTATLVDAPTRGGGLPNPFDDEGVAPIAARDIVPADAATVVAHPTGPVQPATANPFRSIDTATERSKPGHAPSRAASSTEAAPSQASQRAATAQSKPVGSRPAPPRTAGREPGLLQTLIDNIQQPAEPARDTRGMDRLARRLDHAPMPEAAPVFMAAAPSRASPTHASPAPAKPAPTHGADAAAAPPIAAAAAPAPSAGGNGGAPAGGAAQQKQSLRALLEQCPTTNSVQSQRCRRQMCQRAGVEPQRCPRH